jgi:phospholipase C
MSRTKTAILSVVLLSVSALLLNLNGCGGAGTTSRSATSPAKIQHVVVIFQENRTPDNLFQDPD